MTGNSFVFLRAAAMAITVIVLGQVGVQAQTRSTEYRPPVYVRETKGPEQTGAALFGDTGSSNDRLTQALRQAQAALQASPPRYAEAEHAYRVAIAAKRMDARAYFGLGYLYSAQQRYGAALEPYQRAVEIEPRMAEAHFNLALVYLRLKNKEAALKELNILKKLKPALASQIEQQINK
jgi:tetratricopeptide (TPR) repeat protein